MTDKPNETISAEDLALIDPKIADGAESDEAIWSELDDAEAAQAASATPAPVEANGGDDEPALPEQPAPAPAAAPVAQEPEAKPDPWANAPKELREAHEAELAEIAQKAKRAESNLKAHQRKLEELRRNMQPSNSPDKVKEAKEALSRVEEEYPEVVKPVQSALDAISESLTAEQQGRQRAAEADLADIIKDEAAKVVAAHPDVDEFLSKHGGPAFAAWVDDQPRRIREIFVRNGNAIVDGDGAAELIAGYKAFVLGQPASTPAARAPAPETPSLSDRRQRQLDATATPQKTRGRPAVSGIPEDGDPQAIWDAFDAQDQQRARA